PTRSRTIHLIPTLSSLNRASAAKKRKKVVCLICGRKSKKHSAISRESDRVVTSLFHSSGIIVTNILILGSRQRFSCMDLDSLWSGELFIDRRMRREDRWLLCDGYPR